jgi:hypothetical protein
MADAVHPAADAVRLFLVETTAAPDALLRVLSVFAGQQVAPASVAFTSGPRCGSVRIEVQRLDAIRAERLSARLQAAPAVRAVSLGWRAGG